MEWDTVKTFYFLNGNVEINNADIVAMDSLVAEAQALVDAPVALAA